MPIPFYDPYKSYIANYNEGPFGDFLNDEKVISSGKQAYSFLNQNINSPFGIPAGPLLNSKFIKGAFEKGYDLCVYKTVRTSIFPSHPYPNLLAIHKEKIQLDDLNKQIPVDNHFTKPLSITNSFGVPSKDPVIWQEDVKKALQFEQKGQVLILSFMGTIRSAINDNQFIDDYVIAAKLSHETGAKILEVNLSCPNIGNLGLVCYNLDTTKKILKKIRNIISSTPLIIKIGYYPDINQLKKLAVIANEYADAISAINTLQTIVIKPSGGQALPGKKRLKSGICGYAIKWAGLDMVRKLKKLKVENNYRFEIVGVGGVMNPADFTEYRNAGADVVMSATGAMWNPSLAKEIKDTII